MAAKFELLYFSLEIALKSLHSVNPNIVNYTIIFTFFPLMLSISN